MSDLSKNIYDSINIFGTGKSAPIYQLPKYYLATADPTKVTTSDILATITYRVPSTVGATYTDEMQVYVEPDLRSNAMVIKTRFHNPYKQDVQIFDITIRFRGHVISTGGLQPRDAIVPPGSSLQYMHVLDLEIYDQMLWTRQAPPWKANPAVIEEDPF